MSLALGSVLGISRAPVCQDLITDNLPQVLVAFAFSAVLALLAMIFGYCTNSFPENTLTEFDYYYLLIPMRRRFDYISGLFGSSSEDLGNNCPNDAGTARRKCCHALERFLLTLSDQQLVTGLAVLIAGYMRMCSMPLYYFNIIASLAWFSFGHAPWNAWSVKRIPDFSRSRTGLEGHCNGSGVSVALPGPAVRMDF